MSHPPSQETWPADSARALLRQRDYLIYWWARFLDMVGVQSQAVTIGWQVYAVSRQTHTVGEAAFAVGMIGLAQFLPLFALALVSGAVADRKDRRIIMMCCVAVEVVCAAGFAGLSIAGISSLWPVFGLAIVFGAVRAFFSPASTAMAPTLVPRELLPRAIASSSLAWQGASIAGPALGGLLCAVSPALSFAVTGALCLVSLALLALLKAEHRPAPRTGSHLAAVKEGLAYVWREKIVLGAISLDLFAVLLGGATALLPVYARDVLHVGAQGFGILRAAPAVGAAIVAARLAGRPIRSRAGIALLAGVGVYGAATVVFALSTSMALSAAALVVVGGSDMVSVYVRQSLVQIVTPDAMRGRVSSVSGLFIGASNEFGEFETGLLARAMGPVGAALFGGVGAIVVTFLWAWWFPALRKADRLT